MRIAIDHLTRYTYASVASYCVQSLRLTPASFNGQTVIDWQVTVEPAAHATTTRDGFGNVITLQTVSVPHDVILVRARGTVVTEDRNGLVEGLSDGVPSRIYLRRTRLTAPSADIEQIVDSTRDLEPISRLHAMMNSIRDRVDYVPGATGAETTAVQALAAATGVCQDHAHIFIATARSAGIPARYVTGYLLMEDSDEHASAHHAWAEAYVDGLGWVGFDVANRICPTARYVRLAAALDAYYAAPIRGTRRGAAAERLNVIVQVQQQQAEQ